jgi:peptide/nickel transport system permease protein
MSEDAHTQALQLVQQSMAALRRGDRSQSRELAHQAAAMDEKYPDPWLILGVLVGPEESVVCMRRALEIDPQSPRAKEGMHWAIKRLREKQALADQKRGEQQRHPVVPPESMPATRPIPALQLAPEQALTARKRPDFPRLPLLKSRFFPEYGGFSLLIILLFTLTAFGAPLLAPSDSKGGSTSFHLVQPAVPYLPNPPSPLYRLGTVPLGIINQVDVYYTLIWGTRSALVFGVTATLFISLFGSLVGAACSYLGGAAGQAILRITDAFLAFPVIAGIVLFGQLMLLQDPLAEPGLLKTGLSQLGVDNVMLALVCFGWMPYTRVIYADMERIRRSEFVLAAQSVGVRPGRIIFRHLIPNSISNIIVLATRDVGGLVLLQAGFTFIGVGGRSDWGRLLAVGYKWILGGSPFEYWWVFLPATCALVGFGIGWNLLGDFLNERLNPRLRFFITK